jgi:hypothetical protein
MYPGPFPDRLDRPCCGDELSRTKLKDDTSNYRARSGFVYTAAGDYGSSKDTTATADLKSTYLA